MDIFDLLERRRDAGDVDTKPSSSVEGTAKGGKRARR